MLRNSSSYKQRKQHRYNERFSLNLLAPEGTILPYHYNRPSTDPLGIYATETTTDYDNVRSTSPICGITAVKKPARKNDNGGLSGCLNQGDA